MAAPLTKCIHTTIRTSWEYYGLIKKDRAVFDPALWFKICELYLLYSAILPQQIQQLLQRFVFKGIFCYLQFIRVYIFFIFTISRIIIDRV